MGSSNVNESDLYTKQIVTTGEAAEICKVSQQTIIRCFDSGRLGGFRVPGSRFRRIPRDELIRFMRQNSIPTDQLEGGKHKILVVDTDPQIVELFVDVLSHDKRYEVRIASTGYDAGVVSTQFRPQLMVLDYMLPDINGNGVCQTVRNNPILNGMKILILFGMVSQDEIENLLNSGADDFIKKPFNIESLQQRIQELLAL